jgi:hypothetical protein
MVEGVAVWGGEWGVECLEEVAFVDITATDMNQATAEAKAAMRGPGREGMLPCGGNSKSHGARPVRLTITMI